MLFPATAFIAICLSMQAAGAAAQETSPGAIEGIVIDAASKVPLEKVSVEIRFTKALDGSIYVSAANTKGPVALSGPDGRFRLEAKSEIPFRLSATMAGFIRAAPDRTFTLRDGESSTGIVIEMYREASISGRVWDRDLDKPIAGLTVIALQLDKGAGFTRELPITMTPGVSDQQGKYTLQGLAPGNYVVRVLSKSQPRLTPAPEGEPQVGHDYVFSITPGVTGTEEAVHVQALAGMETTGIDFRLRKSPCPPVRGVVSVSHPVERIEFMARPERGVGSGITSIFGTLQSPGAFEIKNLPQGSYTLLVRGVAATRAETTRAVTRFVLSDKPVTGVDLTLLQGADVTGRVRSHGLKDNSNDPLWDSEATRPKVGIVPRLRPPHILEVPQPVEEKGVFAIKGVHFEPMQLWVRELPEGWIVREVLYNGSPLRWDWFELNLAAPSHDLTILVGPAPNHVSGMVKDGDKAAASCVVYGFEERTPEPVLPSPFIVRTKCDADGHYTFKQLLPGKWHLAALPPDGLLTAAFDAIRAGSGSDITVTDSSQIAQDLKLAK